MRVRNGHESTNKFTEKHYFKVALNESVLEWYAFADEWFGDSACKMLKLGRTGFKSSNFG